MSKEYFIVEKILNKREEKGQIQYKIKWVDWPETECTWEPMKNLSNVKAMIKEFEKNYRKDGKDNPSQCDEAEEKKKYHKMKKKMIMKLEKEKDQKKRGRDKKPSLGNISYDVPLRVVGAKVEGGNIQCLIQWNCRYDGTIPTNSFISNKIIREQYPALLLDFYESRLKQSK